MIFVIRSALRAMRAVTLASASESMPRLSMISAPATTEVSGVRRS